MIKEYIEKNKLIEDIECIDISDCTDIDDIFTEVERTIDDQPTADVVEVVRCGECKHITPVEGGLPLCTLHHAAVAYNDYCSHGERKDGAE